jgi:hypothetical protein
MKKLIDLDEETIKALSHMAIDEGTNLKVYIQDVLVAHGQKGTLKKLIDIIDTTNEPNILQKLDWGGSRENVGAKPKYSEKKQK